MTAKPKKKPGRPTTFTAKGEERLLKLVAEGKTFREACRDIGIDFKAVIGRRYADDGFHRRSARATLLGTEANLEMAETRLKKSTNKRISVDRELAHHYRWKASKLLSAYKDRMGIDMNVSVEKKHAWEGKPREQWTEMDEMEFQRYHAFGAYVILREIRDKISLKAAQELIIGFAEQFGDGRQGREVRPAALPAPATAGEQERVINPLPDDGWEEVS
jgi:hypothetical protein